MSNRHEANAPAATNPFAEAVTLPANDAGSCISRGLAYLKLGDYDSAASEFLQYATLAPEDPSGYANLAKSYFMKQDYDLALTFANKALELDQGHLDALFFSIPVLIQQLKPDQALARIDKCLRIDGDNPYYKALRVEALLSST